MNTLLSMSMLLINRRKNLCISRPCYKLQNYGKGSDSGSADNQRSGKTSKHFICLVLSSPGKGCYRWLRFRQPLQRSSFQPNERPPNKIYSYYWTVKMFRSISIFLPCQINLGDSLARCITPKYNVFPYKYIYGRATCKIRDNGFVCSVFNIKGPNVPLIGEVDASFIFTDVLQTWNCIVKFDN